MKFLRTLFITTSLCAACQGEQDDLDGSDLGEEGFGEERIVGGVNTNINVVPWQVSIRTGGGHWCGGSIIAAEWILTAAHCVTDLAGNLDAPSDYEVNAGVTDRRVTGQLRGVLEMFIAPGWTGDVKQGDDIALLRLDAPLDLNGDTVSTIKLATPAEAADFAPGVGATVSGWGTLSEGGPSPDILQSVIVPVVSNATAQTNYAVPFAGISIGGDQLAAGFVSSGGSDSCQGDSGGPLVVSSAGTSLLAGVVSWGYGCARSGYPGMYSRVSYFIDWIDYTVGMTTVLGDEVFGDRCELQWDGTLGAGDGVWSGERNAKFDCQGPGDPIHIRRLTGDAVELSAIADGEVCRLQWTGTEGAGQEVHAGEYNLKWDCNAGSVADPFDMIVGSSGRREFRTSINGQVCGLEWSPAMLNPQERQARIRCGYYGDELYAVGRRFGTVGPSDHLPLRPVEVTPGSDIVVELSPLHGTSGDADLYVRFGAAPSTTTYDCRPYSSSSNETCQLTVPAAEHQAFVMVRGYGGTTDYELKIELPET